MLLRRYHDKQEEAVEKQEAKEVTEIESTNLSDLTVKELKEVAKEKEIEGCSDMKKEELIDAIGIGD